MPNARHLSGEVRVTGVINDEEFAAEGQAFGNPETGEYEVQLEYNHIPRDWDPLMYSDVKVSLLFHRQEGQGRNLLTLADGRYTSAGTIDFGMGNVLRNNTVIETSGDTFRAVYVMYGTARIGALRRMVHFEETMLPYGEGRIAALALARWETETGEPLDALFSTRYELGNGARLRRAQVRVMEAEPTVDGTTFRSTYRGSIRHLPAVVEDREAYIGHLIA